MAKQMRVPTDAKMVQTGQLGHLERGFCHFLHIPVLERRVFFVNSRGVNVQVHFPVLEDGTISSTGSVFPGDCSPWSMIEVLDAETLPIKHDGDNAVWSDEEVEDLVQ